MSDKNVGIPMRRQMYRFFSTWAWTAVLVMGFCGCSQLRLPRIDPQGERVFLPQPNYTTIVGPSELLNCFPEPAYRRAPFVPACDMPAMAVPVAPRSASGRSLLYGPHTVRGPQGQLMVTPGRLSAPIGTEVVLLAGFCAADGFFVTDQPIQWSIPQDSVGQFVDSNISLTNWIHRRSQRLESDFALTRTNCREKLLTRGTPHRSDDVTVRRGQSWVTLTSATSGTTHVSVVAPNAENWDQRRKTAVIEWIDAEWQFPAPVVGRGDEPISLVTRVTRRDGSPVVGWKIRYQISTNSISFAESGTTTAEVISDAQGEARVTARRDAAGTSSAQIAVQVLRPDGKDRHVVIGTGSTTVHWSAPGLSVRAMGPTQMAAGGTATFQMEVHNPGDVATRQVELRVAIPSGLEFLNATPNAQLTAGQLHWNIGTIPPQTTHVVKATCRAISSGDVRWNAIASSIDVARAESAVDTRINESALHARFVQPPQTARIGDEVAYTFEVENTGTTPLYDVAITDQFSDGLSHVDGLTSPIRRTFGTLAPGETKGAVVQFRVRRAGTLQQRVDVTSSDGQSASVETSLEASGTAPVSPDTSSTGTTDSAIEVHLIGDTQRQLGEDAKFTVTVQNKSDRTLTNVQVALGFDPAMPPVQASGGHRVDSGQLIWLIESLAPMATERRAMECRCERGAAQAETKVVVTAAGNIRVEDTVNTVILSDSAVPPSDDRGTLTNQLQLRIHDLKDPVRVGQRTTYTILVKNDRATSDRSISLTIEVSKNLNVEALESSLVVLKQSPDGRNLTLTAIKELRPGESFREIRLEVTAKGPKRDGSVKVTAKSELNPQGVFATETTTLLME